LESNLTDFSESPAEAEHEEHGESVVGDAGAELHLKLARACGSKAALAQQVQRSPAASANVTPHRHHPETPAKL